MRPPPSLGRVGSYPVTGGLALLAVGVTVAWMADRVDVEVVTLDVRAFQGEPWRLLTSVLPHVDVLHLLFNVYWLWVFGTLVEDVLGHGRALALVAFLAAGSGAAEYAVFDGGVGLSGVGYGLFGMSWWLSRRDPRFVEAVDRRTTGLFVVWFFLCIVLTVGGWMPVANVAHGVGWALGISMGAAVASVGWGRAAAVAGMLTLVAASVVGSTVVRPTINLSSAAGGDSARLGYLALVDGSNADAVAHLERALEYRQEPDWWHNLGIAYERLGRSEDARAAFARAAAGAER